MNTAAIWINNFFSSFDQYMVVLIHKLYELAGGFFTPFFEKLIGVDYVRKMIEEGCSAEQISKCWQKDIETFKKQRKPYLLYD